MLARQALAAALATLLALPAWTNPGIIGTASASRAALVRGAELAPGSTLFSGDVIEVGAGGGALIALHGATRIEMGAETQVRVSGQGEKARLEIGKGRVGFVADSSLEVRLADATIRATGAGTAIAKIVALPGKKGIIAVERGQLLITTVSAKRTLTLREGEGVEVTLEPAPAPQVGAGQTAATLTGRWVLVLGLVVGVTVTAIAVWLNRGETKLTNLDKRTEISPFRFP